MTTAKESHEDSAHNIPPLARYWPDEAEAAQDTMRLPLVTEVRPWVRYWARMIDNWLAFALFFFILIFVFAMLAVTDRLSPNLVAQLQELEVLFILPTLFVWVFCEALLLSTWGTTPGKWLLRVTVRDIEGKKPTFFAALKRSLGVWSRGEAFGIPLVTLITGFIAYRTLTDESRTRWDANGGFVVTHETIGWVRIIAALLILVVPPILLRV